MALRLASNLASWFEEKKQMEDAAAMYGVILSLKTDALPEYSLEKAVLTANYARCELKNGRKALALQQAIAALEILANSPFTMDDRARESIGGLISNITEILNTCHCTHHDRMRITTAISATLNGSSLKRDQFLRRSFFSQDWLEEEDRLLRLQLGLYKGKLTRAEHAEVGVLYLDLAKNVFDRMVYRAETAEAGLERDMHALYERGCAELKLARLTSADRYFEGCRLRANVWLAEHEWYKNNLSGALERLSVGIEEATEQEMWDVLQWLQCNMAEILIQAGKDAEAKRLIVQARENLNKEVRMNFAARNFYHNALDRLAAGRVPEPWFYRGFWPRPAS